ncbi:MAG: hypothetical protein F6K62_08875 [Sphaerospermopsis sp. SIO1G2]|nr:hypothetical protein [Sphaerospermopsis sp. SIO1G1]NET71038.1 hypothetical protein [Sphaerospermopsis sp. SIO1G2]
MSKQLPPSNNFQRLPTDAEKEEQLMQDVLLLLENLVEREEATVKLILNCLYDAGATNLINQKFTSRPVNKSLRWVSKISKPAVRVVAWQWFRMNCPQLITDWLRSQIEFKSADTPGANLETPQVEVVVENPKINSRSSRPVEYPIYEVKQLRGQIKILTGTLIGVLALCTGGFLWAGYTLEQSHSQVVEELQNQVKTLEANVTKD